MRELLLAGLRGFDVIAFVYFVVLNSSYVLLITLAGLDAARHFRGLPFAGYREMFASPLTPPVTIIVPAHNEEAVIVESVRSLLALHYPLLEVIVVDDGSTDRTFELLEREFDLVQVPKVIPGRLKMIGRPISVHAARHGVPLLVARKESVGRRSDATNLGLDLARYPLICSIDADAILDDEALLHVVKPFVDDPEHVVAVGGSIRAVNGSVVERGRVVEARVPRGWLARVQVIEYLRAFLLGRVGWSRLHGLLVISGAFGVFRRDLLLEIGGFDAECIGEDAELVTRLHKHLRDSKRDYKMVFVAEPVCWTEVPNTVGLLAKQRRRWSRGLAEVLSKHRGMVGNPRYGRIGLIVLPYFLLFELLGACVEIFGVPMLLLSLALGAVSVSFALTFFAVALVYGLLISVSALAVEEFSYHRYPRVRDLGIGLVAAAVENIGYRQLHSWWRLQGLVEHVRHAPSPWHQITRTGFDTEAA